MPSVPDLISRPLLLAGLSIAVMASPSFARDAKSKASELVPVGQPIDCIQPISISSSNVIDDHTIDFIMRDRSVYRNTLPHSCPSLGFEKRFAYKLSTSQLCSVDMITVLQSFGPGLNQGASCGLGQFQKMENPKK